MNTYIGNETMDINNFCFKIESEFDFKIMITTKQSIKWWVLDILLPNGTHDFYIVNKKVLLDRISTTNRLEEIYKQLKRTLKEQK